VARSASLDSLPISNGFSISSASDLKDDIRFFLPALLRRTRGCRFYSCIELIRLPSGRRHCPKTIKRASPQIGGAQARYASRVWGSVAMPHRLIQTKVRDQVGRWFPRRRRWPSLANPRTACRRYLRALEPTDRILNNVAKNRRPEGEVVVRPIRSALLGFAAASEGVVTWGRFACRLRRKEILQPCYAPVRAR
jgi:hypothetical protein